MQLIERASATTGPACNARPLVVDLDRTLIRADVTVESLFELLKRNFLFVFLMPLWLLKGTANLKHEIAARAEVDARSLPYHEELLDYLESEGAKGRRLILVSASNERLATAIADHLGIFHAVLASSASVNLSGRCKVERLQELIDDTKVEYVANTMSDLPPWEGIGEILLVEPGCEAAKSLDRGRKVRRILSHRTGRSVAHYLLACRVHHWLKNVLIFVPLLMAHRVGDLASLGKASLAFLAFGLCASSVYVLNDMVDLHDDRQHPTKRHRPLAAGSISIKDCAMLIPTLLMAAFGLALFLPVTFIGALALYYTTTLVYSFCLKRTAIVDVLTLAALYTIRIMAGAAAVSVVVSHWLLAFSMFLFLSLALAKRYTELLSLWSQQRIRASGRGYRTTDLEGLSQFGSASAFMSVLVLALYINSDSVRNLYAHPEVIWLLCPLLLYMMTRLWLLARRGQLDADPVVFAMRDRCSQLLASIGAVLLWVAA